MTQYTPTAWVNDLEPDITAGTLLNIENGIVDLNDRVSDTVINLEAGSTSTDINTAITALDGDGGTVLLDAGDYTVTSSILMRSYVTLQGVNRSAVNLRVQNSMDANVIELFDVRQEQVGIRDLTIEGNRTNNSSGHGIYMLNDSLTSGIFDSGLLNPHHFIDNLIVKNCKEDGINMAGDSLGGENHISNVFSYACDGYGFYSLAPDSNWDRCVSGQSGKQGFFLQSPNTRYNNCKAWFSGRIDSSNGDGFYCSDGQRQELTGCESQDNKRHGFVFINTRYFTATGCVADSNGWTVEATGFRFDGAVRGRVTGLSYDKQTIPTQKYHIHFDNNSEANMVDLVCGPWAAGGALINGAVGDNHVRLHQAVASGPSFDQLRSSLVMGSAALATTATDGFLYLSSMAGVPSGVPRSFTGTVPVAIDSTNNKLMAYIGGAWKGVTLS